MLSLRPPSLDTVSQFVAAQVRLDLTYPEVGASAGTLPAGYTIDHNRIQLGEGAAVYKAAQAAFRRWDQFHLGWLDVCTPLPPLEKGQVVAIQARAMGWWWLSACRIVYAFDEAGPISRFGFGYGTLPHHPETGEERFMLEWHSADNSVWYDIQAFSRPHTLAAKLGYPFVRRVQKRFARDSKAAMLLAVARAMPA